MFPKYWPVAVLALVSILVVPMVLAISASEDDDFEDGTTQNWGHGAPTGLVNNIADGGPGGAGDNYLEVQSTGMSGQPGSRLAVLNEMQWTGDYNAVGSEFTISMQLANLGGSALNIRLGVEGEEVLEGVDQGREGVDYGLYVSTTAFNLPADGTWQMASFTLNAANMTNVGGSLSLAAVLDNVIQMRLISAAAADWSGDEMVASVGIDDIQVVSVPVELQSFSIE